MPDDSNPISRIIRDSWDRGEPAGWFEHVYATALTGQGVVPWAIMTPNPDLQTWLERSGLRGDGRTALVVGCGLGDDAEALALLGFQVIAFDISPTAIQWCRQRFPESAVDYHVADLFAPPVDWSRHFNFVLESRTVQSLPVNLAEQSAAQIANFVSADGQLLVLCHGRDPHDPARGIPWPLSRVELAYFEHHGLIEHRFEELPGGGFRRFRVEYRRAS